MQTGALHSFLHTPIIFLTVRVRFGLPVLGDDTVPGLLRDAWLGSAMQDRWFVGPYRVEPTQVSLLACPGYSACSPMVWTTLWKAAVAARLKERIGGRGQLWEFGLPPEPVMSAADYRARRAILQAESTPAAADFLGTAQIGILWELLPDGLPAPAPIAVR